MAGGGKKGPDPTPIDKELAKAGAFGRFQVYITLTIVFGIMSVNLLTHGIAILELAPVEPNGYLCTNKATGIVSGCSPDDWCGNDMVTSEVNYAADPANIYNWYTKLELACKP